MSVPDYQALMLPILKLAVDGEEHRFRDVVETLADELGLTNEERSELLPSGQQPLFTNRVGWARTYLKHAGLLGSPRRGVLKITQRGHELLAENPPKVDLSVLRRFEEFVEFQSRRRTSAESVSVESLPAESSETPEDTLSRAYGALRKEVEAQLLETVAQVSPSFFEQLVVDVLVAMGYGGNRVDAARAIGRSGDGGVDGIINEDRLGFDVIYIQAKRWEAVVGRPEIQKFAGALQGHRARKGVFITTSGYSREAIEYVKVIDTRIILIDGPELAKLMFNHGVGVSPIGTYDIKRIDSDYFSEE